MNKFKTKIDGKLQLSNVVQTIIDVAIPETEIVLDNYKDYAEYDILAYFTIDAGSLVYNTTKVKLFNGVAVVKTSDLMNAKTLSYLIKHKELPTVNATVSLDLTAHRHSAQVFEHKDTKKISQVLYDICDTLENIDLRLKELEKDKEQELI